MSKTIEKPILDARELRVSQNYLYDGSIIKLDGSLLSMYLQNDTDLYLYPIPLTEDVLLKCGFSRHHDDYYNEVILLKDVITKDFTCKLFPKELGSAYQIKNSIKVKYLHQLQNLYFALTNQELEIKL